MKRKKKEKTVIELASEEIQEVLAEYKCELWSVPRLSPIKRSDGQIIWDIVTEIKVVEKKDDKEAKPK